MLIVLGLTTVSHAIVVVPNTSAQDLAAALTRHAPGISVTGTALEYRSIGTAVSTGIFTNDSGTYGIGNGIILSTGDVSHYGDGPNTTSDRTTSYGTVASPERKELLDPITGPYSHFDVSQLDLTFDLLPGYDSVRFNLVFGSEEYSEFAHSVFLDGFGIYLNGVNIAIVAGLPINISHPDVRSFPGTELDGVLAPNDNPVVPFTAYIGSGRSGNVLTIILADTSDSMLDTTVYVSGLEGIAVVPEPGSLIALAGGIAGVAGFALRRHRGLGVSANHQFP